MLTGKSLFPGKNIVHQLDIMTDLLGTPSSKALARIRNEKSRRYLSNIRKKPEIPFSHKFPNVDSLALRLLERLLSFDPKDRPSAKDALADPYFQGLANVEREPSTRAISKLEFEFERKKLAKDDHASLPRERVPTPKVEIFTLQGNNTEKTTKTLAVTTHDSPRGQNQGSENAAEPTSARSMLKNMTRMLMITDVHEIIKKHQAQIITSLKDPDISIWRHSLDLLYGMCDVSNAKDIVEELLHYLATIDFAMLEELALKAAILAEKFAPDLSWYVDVILQLIDKARNFVTREYLDKPAIHETMVKVNAYLLGEYSHLLAKRPGCSSKEIFAIIHEKLPINQILAVYSKYEICIYAEIQQRAVEYFVLSRKGAVLMDILAEMPKFLERQSLLIKKAEDIDADIAKLSVIKLRAQQQTSNALVATDQRPANGAPQASGANFNDAPPTTDMLGNLLSLLSIEGPPAVSTQLDHNGVHGHEGTSGADDALALAPVENQESTICIKAECRDYKGRFVLFLENKNTAPLDLVQEVILPPSHLKLELSLLQEVIPPRAQVQCPLEVVNLRPSRDVAVLEFFYKLDATNARDE
ncbi:AP-2 complex subunit alpha-1-like protein [Tanacetum coccineum]|uniref:AP-2 complex subunit alpha-1-like protein n=1 Tax=Tanacetum coccineum TaxID=301880 RepID=A0ABQ4YTG2_9ASTR